MSEPFPPCHRFDPEETFELPKKPNSAATYAARRGAKTWRLQWSARDALAYGTRLSEHLEAGSSWEDLAALVAEDGLTLEAKGKGYVIGDAASYVKLSALGLQRIAKGFARRHAPAHRHRAAKASRPLVDAVDIAQAFVTWGLADQSAVRDAVWDAQAQRLARLAKRPLIEQLLADLKKTLAATTAHTPPGRRHLRPKPSRISPKRHQRGDYNR